MPALPPESGPAGGAGKLLLGRSAGFSLLEAAETGSLKAAPGPNAEYRMSNPPRRKCRTTKAVRPFPRGESRLAGRRWRIVSGRSAGSSRRVHPFPCSPSLRANAAGRRGARKSSAAANGSASRQAHENLRMAELFNSVDPWPSAPIPRHAHPLDSQMRQGDAARGSRQQQPMALQAARHTKT